MESIRDNPRLSSPMLAALDESTVDAMMSESYESGGYNRPILDRTEDLEVKPADTDEDDSDELVEVKSGTAESDEEKGWYRVDFEQPFADISRPVVVATGNRRLGEMAEGEFEPPSYDIDLPEETDVDIRELLFETDIDEVTTDPIDEVEIDGIDDIEVPGMDIHDFDVSTPSITEREIDYDGFSPDIDPSIDDPDLDRPEFISPDRLGAINIPQLDEIDVDIGDDLGIGVEPGDFSIPEPSEDASYDSLYDRFRSFSREIGRGVYEGGSHHTGVLPDSVEEHMDDFIDRMATETFGDGSGNLSPVFGTEGELEAVFGDVGALLDFALAQIIDNARFMSRDLSNDAEEEIIELADQARGTMIDIVDEFNKIDTDLPPAIEQVIEDELLDIEDELNQYLSEDLEDVLLEQAEQINNNIVDPLDDVEDSFFDFTLQIEDKLVDYAVEFEDIALEMEILGDEISNEAEDLAFEIEDEMNFITEDINYALTAIVEDVKNQSDFLSEELEYEIGMAFEEMAAQVNETNLQITDELNDTLSDFGVEVTESLEIVEADINDQLDDLDAQFEDISDEMRAFSREVRESIEESEERRHAAMTEVAAMAEEAMNDAQRLFYDTVGMPEGELMVPVQTRNVDAAGFEFLGYEGGTEIDWVAIGRGGEARVRDSDGIVDEVIRRLVEEGIISPDDLDTVDLDGVEFPR